MALSYGRTSVVKILIQNGAQTNIIDKIGDTAKNLIDQLLYPRSILDPFTEDPLTDQIPAALRLVQANERNSFKDVMAALDDNASPNTIVPLTLHWPGINVNNLLFNNLTIIT